MGSTGGARELAAEVIRTIQDKTAPRDYGRMRAPRRDELPWTIERANARLRAMTLVAGCETMTGQEMLAFGRVLRRALNKRSWRNLMATRCAALARALRLSERALGPSFGGRHKTPRGWVLTLRVGDELHPALLVSAPPLRHFTEAPGPIEVICLRHEGVDMDRLRRLLAQPTRRSRR
jgi:hypothetical protein